MPRLWSWFVAACTALLMAAALFASSPAAAQNETPPASPPAAASGNGCSWYDFNCNVFGNPADLQKNIDAAQQMVDGLGCWACKVFNSFGTVVFANGDEVASQADHALKPVIIAVATLFSLFYLGSAFVSGDGSDLLGRWKVFWRLCIAVAVGSAWMSGGGSFNNTWNYVYGPLLAIPLAVEKAIPTPGGGGGNCNPAARAPANAPPGSSTVMNEMATVVCGANTVSLKGIAFGIGLTNTGDGILGSFVNAVTGIILMIVFGWIAITFPLRFIDVMLRLAVVGIVTPVLVVCAVFKPTRSYCQIAVKNVLYAGCLFAFTGIMFKLGFTFLMQMFADQTAGTSAGAIGSGTAGQLLGKGIVLVGSGVIFSAMVKMAPSLAAEFSSFSGSSGGVGDAATSFSSTVVTAPVKAAGLATGGVAAVVTTQKAAGAFEGAVAKGAEAGTSRAIKAGLTPPTGT